MYELLSHHYVSFLSWMLRRLRAHYASKFHIQLCLSLGAMFIVFVAGIDRTENRVGCVTVGVLIHYFTLVAWMWMGAEALLMFQKLIIVFGNITRRYIILVSLFCWGRRTNSLEDMYLNYSKTVWRNESGLFIVCLQEASSMQQIVYNKGFYVFKQCYTVAFTCTINNQFIYSNKIIR